MYDLPTLSPPPDPRLWHGFTDDFDHLVTADRWTSILTDTGTNAVGDAAGGVMVQSPSDGTVADNDEAYLHTTAELFLIAAGKPIIGAFNAQFAQADTDKANHIAGFMSGVVADALIDDGGGLLADFSGAVFYCLDGDTLWRVMYSDGTTKTSALLEAANSLSGVDEVSASTAFQRLEITIQPVTATLVDICFFIDAVLVYKMKDKTIASATEMAVVLGSKNGVVSKHEILNVDLVQAYQKR